MLDPEQGWREVTMCKPWAYDPIPALSMSIKQTYHLLGLALEIKGTHRPG